MDGLGGEGAALSENDIQEEFPEWPLFAGLVCFVPST